MIRDVKITIATFALGASLAMSSTIAGDAQQNHDVEVWKSPYCGCCAKWIEKMTAAGFKMRVHDREDTDSIKNMLGVPASMRSCHTAKVGGYIVEGHVPAADVHRMLKVKPKIIGLSVPGMPIGSPGMEVSSGEKEHFKVYGMRKNGDTSIFAEHN